MKLYVASSWRNPHQQNVVRVLREFGHDVYDFKNPAPGNNGFGWRSIDPDWKRWSPRKFAECLNHPIAEAGYQLDFQAMAAAEGCVLVLPCGRSAHIEAGWFCGRAMPVWILIPPGKHSYSNAPCAECGDMEGCHGGVEPELMYKLASEGVFDNLNDLCESLSHFDTPIPGGVGPDGQPAPVV
jgi:hypothetical protein